MSGELRGFQRRALRGLAHELEPSALVGREGLGKSLIDSVEQALLAHELIKVRFVARKDERHEMARELAERVDAALAGVVGHVAILYRPHPEPERRRIELPQREG